MTQVKICGINDPSAFDATVEAGADWVGFNFFPPSPRFITPGFAATLSARVNGGPQRVGLFVEPTEEAIAEVLHHVKLDALQVYGAADRLAAIKARFGLPAGARSASAAPRDLPTGTDGADRLLLEARPPAGSDRPGGNATIFDWSVLRGWTAPGPWMLAGGLTTENVALAISETGASAVDVSSGVERAKGVKDANLIRAFVQAAKG